MTRQSSNRFSSMDGFVPGGQGRRVSFDSQLRRSMDGSRTPILGDSRQRMRQRRPSLHSTTDGLIPKTPGGAAGSDASVPRRHNFPEFTAYTSPSSKSNPLGERNGPRQRDRDNLRTSSDTRSSSRSGRRDWKKILKRTTAVLGVFILLGGGWLGFNFFKNSRKVFGGDANILGFLNASKLRGEDKGRVNVLIAGVSTDDPGHEGAALTDSIMIASLDTVNKKAFLLSIPRDMWVNIPGYGHSKINAANAYGDADKFSESGYPAGGMGLLEKVISNNFGIAPDYYAKVNYSAFRDAVNAVGGINVTIQSSDPRGLYDPNISKVDHGPLRLKNGNQVLDGQTALNLARARGDPTNDGRIAYGFERSDFTRTQNQRMMMVALKDKVASSSVLANPLKVGQLFDAVGKNVKTDFQPSEIRRLYDLNKQVQSKDIASVSLNDFGGVNLLASYRTADGASALIPADGLDDFDTIRLNIKKLFSNDPVVKESAKVVILNGGGVTGMASKESNSLTSKGINVVAVGDAPKQAGPDVIIDMSAKNGGAKPGTLAKLKQLFNVTTVRNDNAMGYPTADFIIVLGTQHQPTFNQAASGGSQ